MRNAALPLLSFLFCARLSAAGYEIAELAYAPSPVPPSGSIMATNGKTFPTLWQLGTTVYGSLAGRGAWPGYDVPSNHRTSCASTARSSRNQCRFPSPEDFVVTTTEPGGVFVERVRPDGTSIPRGRNRAVHVGGCTNTTLSGTSRRAFGRNNLGERLPARPAVSLSYNALPEEVAPLLYALAGD